MKRLIFMLFATLLPALCCGQIADRKPTFWFSGQVGWHIGIVDTNNAYEPDPNLQSDWPGGIYDVEALCNINLGHRLSVGIGTGMTIIDSPFALAIPVTAKARCTIGQTEKNYLAYLQGSKLFSLQRGCGGSFGCGVGRRFELSGVGYEADLGYSFTSVDFSKAAFSRHAINITLGIAF